MSEPFIPQWRRNLMEANAPDTSLPSTPSLDAASSAAGTAPTTPSSEASTPSDALATLAAGPFSAHDDLVQRVLASHPGEIIPVESDAYPPPVQTTAGQGGVKYDQGKARFDLVPPEAMEAMAEILTYGAAKYGDRNWEKGMAWSRPYAATLRHMFAWFRGVKADPETGKSPLWHALCELAFLVTYEVRGTGKDDRP